VCLSCGCVLRGTGTPDDDHGDARNITRSRVRIAADAAEIGTVAAGRNILGSLGASELDDFDVAKTAWTSLLKAEPERRYTLMLAWPALKPDVAKAQDGRRDYARPEVIEQTAWAWMVKSRTVGLYHADGTEGHGTVVESYVYRGPDWQVRPDTLIKAGDWLIGTIWDTSAWALVKAGLINGMSPQGNAKRAPADPSLTFDRS
jgi:Putative phage serine protease XkdF